jgi:7-cyano-7-deazaguanine synthase
MLENQDNTLVVLSGGQDSTTCLGWALKKFKGQIAAVSFDYGQKHKQELKAARKVVAFFRRKLKREIKHEIVYLGPHVFAGTSPLTNPLENLETYNNYQEMDKIIGDRVEKTFVPMRNAVFLMLAANRAICLGMHNIVIGVCQTDNANYPDCRLDFLVSAENTINLALGMNDFTLYAPLLNKTKVESIRLAMKLPHTYEALAFTHTAYDGKYPPVGQDHASILRAQGFLKASVPDPLVVRAWREGLMPLPGTKNYDGLRTKGE